MPDPAMFVVAVLLSLLAVAVFSDLDWTRLTLRCCTVVMSSFGMWLAFKLATMD